MKKSETIWKLLGTIFLILGTVFLFLGVFSQMGLLHSDPASQGDPKLWYPVLGGILIILGVILCGVSYRKLKACKLLIREGTNTKGHVTSVKQLVFTRWNGSSPYVVCFAYEVEGCSYKGKSNLLWSQPEVCEQNAVTVYIDSEKPAHCAVDL